MTNLNEKISRRKFLQLTAGAAIGAAMLNVPGMTPFEYGHPECLRHGYR